MGEWFQGWPTQQRCRLMEEITIEEDGEDAVEDVVEDVVEVEEDVEEEEVEVVEDIKDHPRW